MSPFEMKSGRTDMNVRKWISRGAARALRAVMIVAALSMSLGLHPSHAHPPAGLAGSGLLDVSCAVSDHDGAPGAGHSHHAPKSSGKADCAHHFHPVLRSSALVLSSFTSDPVPAQHSSRLRQIYASFDPPPPRLSC